MNEERQELLFDLLAKKAIYGLDESEERELATFDAVSTELEFRSLEITAAAISMAGLDAEDPMPAHIRERILDRGEEFVRDRQLGETPVAPAENAEGAGTQPVLGSWFGWLGWAAAAAASIALAFNIWSTRIQPSSGVAGIPAPNDIPRPLTPNELREELLRSEANIYKANWGAGNVKDLNVSGDIVWSEARQSGYMRFRGLPVNDAEKTCYQLWIFDKTQDKATPIDGGTFDVTAEGEVIIPINAKLQALGPEMFAITIEKHGGVVVSKRGQIAALAKVETGSL